MVRFIFFLLLTSNCSWGQSFTFNPINTGTTASFRGLSVVDDNVAWVSGSKGWIGVTTDGGKTWAFTQLKEHTTLDFRSIYAFDKTTAIIANAGSPAYILKTIDGGRNWKQVYTNNNKDAFIDGVDFWNKKEGIVFGDAIHSKMLLLHTTDGGDHWTEQADSSRPFLAEGEGSFAASGTTIRWTGKKSVAIATGGKKSHLWISINKGNSWNAIETPIIQGTSAQGIFSFAFKDDLKKIVIVGGDFQQDTLRKDHVFYTEDGGTTWNAPASPTRGYRECVEYINSSTLISTGPTGTDVSNDGGKNWSALSDQKSFHVIRKARKGNLIVIAGGNGQVSVVKN